MKKLILISLILSIGLCSFSQKRVQISKDLRNISKTAVHVTPTDEVVFTISTVQNNYVSNSKELEGEDIIGYTFYDLWSNSMVGNRMYVYPDGTMAAVWIRGIDGAPNFDDRGTGYNYFDGTTWGPDPSARIEDERTGWPSYAPLGENGEIVVAHLAAGLKISTREQKGTGDWTYQTLNGPTDLTWPRVSTSGDDHMTVHILANSYVEYEGQTTALFYYRSLDGGDTWDIEAEIIDGTGEDYYTEIGADEYVWADPNGGAIAFLVAGAWHDMFMMKSTDNGDSWEKTVIWEHPYPFFDWDVTITDEFYCVDKSANITLDNDGIAHVVFGISKAYHADVGTTYNYYPLTDGVGYWNETMPTFSNNLNALSPYGDPGSELVEDVNLVGWTQDVDGSGTIDFLPDIMTYRELGISTMPSVAVSNNGEVLLAYASTTETYDNNIYNYKHIWVRTKSVGGNWGAFEDLDAHVLHMFDECIYPVIGQNITNNSANILYQADFIPGVAFDDDHSYVENRIIVAEYSLGDSWANFSADNTSGYPPLTVQFTDLSSDNATSWQWDFDNDGTIDSDQQNPEWVYNQVGTYTVSLAISNGTETFTQVKANYITANALENHFYPIWTGNPYQPMTVIVNLAQFVGNDLQPDDEIGIFDDDGTGNLICVGVGYLTSPLSAGSPLSITVSADDPTTTEIDGFISGDTIQYKLWEDVTQTEVANVAATYNPAFDEVFTTLGTAIVSLSGYAHYEVAWIGNPYQPMTILLSSLTVDGSDFSIGDEVGIFDVDGQANEICVGAGIITGTVSSATPLAITTSADDPDTPEMDGFTTGNTILFKAWSSVDQTEFSSYQATYNPALDDTFTPLGTALVDVEFNSSITQTIELSQGWNIMSFYVTPDDMNMLSILDSLVTSSELTKVINEAGGFIQNIPGVGWMNTIGDMANTEGYYIKVSNTTSLEVTGMAVDSPFTIPLSTGWNMMSYPMEQPEDAIVILQPLIDVNELTKVINEAGGFIQFIPGVGWMNTIGNFEGGEGYYIKVTANTSLTIGGTSPTWQCGDPLEDPRDGQTYNTVQIGNQCWMAENLNIGTRIDGASEQTDNSTIEKYCYNNDENNCTTYGGLYQWNEMMQYVTPEGPQGICPDGWKLPTDTEWTTLTDYLGGSSIAGGKMKETGTTHWSSPNTGATNSSGFTALPGGYRVNTGSFSPLLGYRALWWSSTEYSGITAWPRYLNYDSDQVYRYSNYKTNGCSVRCLKN